MSNWRSDVPRSYKDAADTREEHAAMEQDMDRSRDEIADQMEDGNE